MSWYKLQTTNITEMMSGVIVQKVLLRSQSRLVEELNELVTLIFN